MGTPYCLCAGRLPAACCLLPPPCTACYLLPPSACRLPAAASADQQLRHCCPHAPIRYAQIAMLQIGVFDSDGTLEHAGPVPCAEVEPAVAEELIGLLEKAAANPKPAATTAAGDTSPTRAAGGKAAGGKPAVPAAAAVPGMVGAGLMGMPDPYMMVRFASTAAVECSDRGSRVCLTRI